MRRSGGPAVDQTSLCIIFSLLLNELLTLLSLPVWNQGSSIAQKTSKMMEIFKNSHHGPYWHHWVMDCAQKSFQYHMPKDETEGFFYHGKARKRDKSSSWPEENLGSNWALRNAEGSVQTTAQRLETSLLVRLISTGEVRMKPWV